MNHLDVARGSLALMAKATANAAAPQRSSPDELLVIAREAVDAARALIETTRRSRSEVGPPLAQRALVDVASLVHPILDATRIAFPDATVRVENTPQIRADSARLSRVLENLVGNAAKHSGPRARIEIKVDVDEREAHFRVSDEGHGIALRDQWGIFWHAPRPDGHGAGLPNALDLVHEMGGRLWLESAPGKGTTVHFTIPQKVS